MKEPKIFHGGCVGCLSQKTYGIKRCYKCRYHKANWDLEDLCIDNFEIKEKQETNMNKVMTGDFYQVYQDFDEWLAKLGFMLRHSHTHMDYHYSDYDAELETMCSVEHYEHSTLQLSIRFLRGKHEHKIIKVFGMGIYGVTTLDAFKEHIKNIVIDKRKHLIEELNKLDWLVEKPVKECAAHSGFYC